MNEANDHTDYSPFMEGLRARFEQHAQQGTRYLLMYWQGWGETIATRAVKSGAYPWAVHDQYMAADESASILAIAFDLEKDFDSQIPDHMRGFETLEGFAYKPLIHIPDRTGHVPAEREAEMLRDILRPRPN